MKTNAVTLNITPLRTEISPLIYEAESHFYQGTITITNEGYRAVEGPLEVIFRTLTSGVTLRNATGSSRRNPLLRVPLESGLLLPGSSLTVPVTFVKSAWSLRGIRYEIRIVAAGFQQEPHLLSTAEVPMARTETSSRRLAPRYTPAVLSLQEAC